MAVPQSPLVRNAAWNLAGLGVPFLIAVVTVPILIPALGEERFGVLTLAWSLIGYFSIFDLGLSRALTRVVAREAGRASHAAWSAMIAMTGLGLLSGLALAAAGPWLIESALRMSPALRQEASAAFLLLAAGVPVTICSTGLRGILEGHQRFGAVAIVRLVLGTFTFAGPLAVLPFSHELPAVVGVLVTGRLVACAAFLLLCLWWSPELAQPIAWRWQELASMLRFGGWVTVSNILGPLINTGERFLIAGAASVVALTYFQTPNEVLSRLGILPFAIATALFPQLSAGFDRDAARTGELAVRSTRWLLMLLGPLTLSAMLFAEPALALWLGPEFAASAAPAVGWLVVVHFFGCLLQIPNTVLHAGGRPDLFGKLQVVELPVYSALFYGSVARFGIAGAAAAIAFRGAVELAWLLYHNARLLPDTRRAVLRIGMQVAVTLGALALATLPATLLSRTLWLLAGAPLLLVAARKLIPVPARRMASPAEDRVPCALEM